MIGSIIALAKREATRDWSEKGRMSFDIAWPLMILIVLGFGVDAFARPRADLSYASFLGAGVIGLLVMRQCASFARGLEQEARHGYREYLVTPVPRRLIIIGSFIGKGFMQSVVALIVLAVYAVLISVSGTSAIDPTHLIMSIIAVGVSVFAGLAVGFAIAVLVKDVKLHTLKSWIVAIALALISGVLFPVTDLPFGLNYIAYASPLTYVVDSIRAGLIGVAFVGFKVSLIVVAMIGIACLLVGLWKSERLFEVV